jgi:hypothetical protein
MRTEQFYQWLLNSGYDVSTSKSRLSNCIRVSEHEGDLEFHFRKDRCNELLQKLVYTNQDKMLNSPPKHNIPINGDVYNGTATLKQALKLYIKFCESFDRMKDTEQKKEPGIKFNQSKALDEKLEPRDSYERFLSHFNINKEDLYEFGLNETIFPSYEKVGTYWNDLKNRILNNGKVYIRGYGRDANGTALYIGLYKHLFNNTNIHKDPTNNFIPQKLIQELTGYKRNENIFNYQVSHIFGKTKNVFMFESPWNIVLVPKLIDPLTGHETKGEWPEDYQKIFLTKVNYKYKYFIKEFNEIVQKLSINEGIKEYCEYLKVKNGHSRVLEQFQSDALKEFKHIEY